MAVNLHPDASARAPAQEPAARFFSRLSGNPRVSMIPVQGNLFFVSGGFARTFLFFTDRRRNEAVLIDPSVSNDFMHGHYFREMAAAYGKKAAMVFSDFGHQLPIHVMAEKSDRVRFLNALREAISTHADESSVSEAAKLCFASRGTQIADLLNASGITLKGVYVTHTHIDHLGVASVIQAQIRERGGNVEIFVPDPSRINSPVHTPGIQRLLNNGTDSVAASFSAYPANPAGELKAIDLNGHTQQKGLLLPNGYFIVGDLIGPENALGRTVYYVEELGEHLRSLNAAREAGFTHLLLSHGASFCLAKDDALRLIKLNEEHVREMKRILNDCCGDIVLASDTIFEMLGLPAGDIAAELQERIKIVNALEGYKH